MKQKLFKQALYAAVNEPDNGLATSNPYILAKRHMASTDMSVDITLINGILAFHGITITQEELGIIKNIQPVEVPFPLPPADEDVINIVGKANKLAPKVAGAYLLTLQSDGRQYVGGTKQMAKRVRYYYNSKGLKESRPIAKLMQQFGPSSFNLKVFIIDPNMFSVIKPMTNDYLTTLVLALEQYLILSLKPRINSVLVVGGVSTTESGSAALAEATSKQMKPVYVYNADKSLLLYISKSRADLAKDTGLHQVTINRHLNDTLETTPLYNTYLLKDNKLDNAVLALMSTDEFRESLTSLHSNRMKLRATSDKVASNMHSIKLTHLDTVNPVPVSFVSKSQASKHTYTVNSKRAVPEKLFKRALPFTHNGWLVEQG